MTKLEMILKTKENLRIYTKENSQEKFEETLLETIGKVTDKLININPELQENQEELFIVAKKITLAYLQAVSEI